MITAPGVLSAISGGALRPWHHASAASDRQGLVDRLLDGEHVYVLFYLGERPMGQDDDRPGHQLKVVVRDGHGAVHFTNMDAAHGPVGAWLATTDKPMDDVPLPIFDPWDPGRATVPVEAVLTLERIRALVVEYATTGNRSSHTGWLAVDFV